MFTTLQSFIQVSVPVTVLLVLVLLLVAARPDRDDTGDGLYATYLSVVGVSALYLVLVFGVTCLSAVVQRVVVDQPVRNSQGISDVPFSGVASLVYGTEPNNPDQLVQTAVLAGLLTLGAAFVFVFHLRRRQELAASEGFAGSAAARVDRAYVGAVSFVAVLVGITALGFAGYGVFRIIAPDVTGSNSSFEEQQGVAELVAFGALLAFSIVLFRTHFWEMREHDDPAEL